MSKRRLIVSMVPAAAALALECLPTGAVLQFARAPEAGEGTQRATYAYFSLAPFGYANFFPLVTALLTVVALLMVVSMLWRPAVKHRRRKVLFVITFAAFLASLMPPIQFGAAYLSLTGAVISSLLLISLILQKTMGRRSR